MVVVLQEVVLGDVRRSVAMFEKHQIPVAGIVENMTMFACEKCGHLNEPLFAVAMHLMRMTPCLDINIGLYPARPTVK